LLYKYDKAIVDDLTESFNPDSVENPVVRVISPDKILDLAAQIQQDKIQFPIVALSRDTGIHINSELYNFSRAQFGVRSVLDNETNMLYYEKAIPINLSYIMTLLTTNQADMDELLREIIFKYTAQYFLEINLPYECNRKIRFGINIDKDSIESSSGSFEYLESGQLYQTMLTLKCEGAVLVHYTPAHLKRIITDDEIILAETQKQ